MEDPVNTDNLIQNMISAAKLDVNFFNAVEHDESKNQEALTVVIIAAVASALGNGILGIFSKRTTKEGAIAGMLSGILFTGSYIIYFSFIVFFYRVIFNNLFMSIPIYSYCKSTFMFLSIIVGK